MPVILFAVFVLVPIAEIVIIIQIGRLIGPWWTAGLLLLSAIVGSWLLGREGRRTWQAFREAVAAGRVPTREVADGALVILGAALMITPGFLSDAVGVLCLLPPTRGLLRRLLTTIAGRRLVARVSGTQRVRARRGAGQRYEDPRAHSEADPRIIEGEVEP